MTQKKQTPFIVNGNVFNAKNQFFGLPTGCEYCENLRLEDLKHGENFCKNCGRHLRGVSR